MYHVTEPIVSCRKLFKLLKLDLPIWSYWQSNFKRCVQVTVVMVMVMVMHIPIESAISSVWKVQFQQFKHFSVAYNELFHMVCLTQNCFSTQIWPFFALVPWINIHDSCILSRKLFLCWAHHLKELIGSYRKMFKLLELDLPNWSYWLSNFGHGPIGRFLLAYVKHCYIHTDTFLYSGWGSELKVMWSLYVLLCSVTWPGHPSIIQDGLLSQGNGELINKIYSRIPKISPDGRRLQVGLVRISCDSHVIIAYGHTPLDGCVLCYTA